MSKIQICVTSRTIATITIILGIIAVTSYTNILQPAYAQTSITSDQVLDKIKQLDSDLNSQFQLLNPTSMPGDTYSGIVWQTQDSSFTFSVDALNGDQGQRQAQFANFMKTTSTEQSTTISGHPGWIQVYNDYYNVWVNVRWGDGNYFSPFAEFSYTIPPSITGKNDQVNAFKDQKQKDAMDIVNKIDGIITQHGFYNFEGTAQEPAPPQHLPIVFIPGVAGSYLYSVGSYLNSQTWPRAGTDAKYMFLQEDGITPVNANSQITATGILASHGTGSSENPFNFYGGFEDYLVSKQNYTLGNDLVEFPYDWRLDNSKHLPELDQVVDSVLKKTNSQKVILIAHSMGGLIAKAYVNGLGSSKVDTLITIGTPFYGAVKPYYALTNGYDFGNPAATRLSMKILAQNAPGVYQLLPRIPFVHDIETARELTIDESNQIKYKGVQSGTITYYETPDNSWSFNSGLIQNANDFHSKIGTKDNPVPLPDGVKHYVIIGTGVETLDGYDVINAPQDKQFVELFNRHVWLVPSFGDGDGTVPIWSSQISGATQTYYIQYKSEASSEHGKLTDNPDVQKIVGSILSGSPADSSSYSNQGQTKTDWTTFSLHSNAHLTILDEKSGKTLGFNNQGEIDEDIDTGAFLAMDGGEYASINDVSDTYKVLVNGTGDGKFTLIANVTRSGQSTVFSYQDVPVQQGTIAQVELSPNQMSSSNMPTLQVNSGGQTTSVSPTPGANLSIVPEFPISLFVLVIALTTMVFFSKVKVL